MWRGCGRRGGGRKGGSLAVVAALVALLAASCSPAPESAATQGSGAALAARDNRFDPSTIEVGADQEFVRVTVTNEGDNPHTFTYQAGDFEVDTEALERGQSRTLVFPAPTQDAEFVCSIHEPQGMTGTLDVLDD